MVNKPASHRRWALLVTAVVCTAVLSVAVMRTSVSRGRLAFYPRLDDVMYMARGAELAQAGREAWKRAGGWGGAFGAARAVAHDWKRQPPHSPWASGAAAIGFGAFGYREWAAYVPTALPVLGLLLCAARMARRAGGWRNWRAHALVIFAATAPFLAASEFILKPDYAAGICAAIAIMKALRGPLLAAPWRRLVWIGVLFGLSLLAKPAMMLPTGMLAAGTLAICTARDLALRSRQHRSAERPMLRVCRAWLLVLGTMAVVAAPHYALALRGAWEYTAGTLTGEGIEMWGYRGSWGQHGAYYLTGPGGHLMLDGARSLIPLGLALALYGCFAFSPRSSGGRSRRRMVYFAATLAALTMAWAGPTLATVKIPQFASCFSALLWLVGIRAAAGVCRAVRPPLVPRRSWLRRLRAPLIASLLVGALLAGRLATYRWTVPLWPADRSEPARAKRDARDEFVRRTYEAIRAECGATARGARSIVVAGGQYDLAWPLLRFWCIRDGVVLRVGEVQRKPETTDIAEAERIGRSMLDGYDLLLVGQSVARKDIPNVVQMDADEYYLGLARTDARFELVARTVDPASGAAFELFRRRAGL